MTDQELADLRTKLREFPPNHEFTFMAISNDDDKPPLKFTLHIADLAQIIDDARALRDQESGVVHLGQFWGGVGG
jgi:hypothetical protein